MGKVEYIRHLENVNAKLSQENKTLKNQVTAIDNLPYIKASVEIGEPSEGGYVEVRGTCYQDIVGILINNGYVVTVENTGEACVIGLRITKKEGKE